MKLIFLCLDNTFRCGIHECSHGLHSGHELSFVYRVLHFGRILHIGQRLLDIIKGSTNAVHLSLVQEEGERL